MSFGKWKDMKKFQEWLQTPEFKTLFAKLEALCDDIKVKTTVSVVNIP
jgi:quinol monooxygenase YgiN